MEPIDQIILGDNQFFGVNHMSQEKGQKSYEKFKDIGEIKKILYMAMDYGIKGVMFSTHPAIYEITDMIRQDRALKENYNIYVNLPYIVKYVRMASEMGMIKAMQTTMTGQSMLGSLNYFVKGAYSVISNDYLALTNRLMDIEMNPFYGLKVKAVFLHNALADLALGYNLTKVIKSFSDYIAKKYQAMPAFGTLNLPKFSNFVEAAGIDQTIIMTAINKKGFLMNPSRQSCEEYLKDTKHTILAMATLASGAVKPPEAYEYVFAQPNLKHVVVGLSTKEHADETFRILKQYIK